MYWYVARSVGDFSWAYPFTGRDSNYLGSMLEEDGELDAEVPPQREERLEELEENLWRVG